MGPRRQPRTPEGGGAVSLQQITGVPTVVLVVGTPGHPALRLGDRSPSLEAGLFTGTRHCLLHLPAVDSQL